MVSLRRLLSLLLSDARYGVTVPLLIMGSSVASSKSNPTKNDDMTRQWQCLNFYDTSMRLCQTFGLPNSIQVVSSVATPQTIESLPSSRHMFSFLGLMRDHGGREELWQQGKKHLVDLRREA